MLRMEQARVLLKQSENSINEVAYACGFHDALYFRRVFKSGSALRPRNTAQRSKGYKELQGFWFQIA